MDQRELLRILWKEDFKYSVKNESGCCVESTKSTVIGFSTKVYQTYFKTIVISENI